MKPNLFPCPFCGGKARLDQRETQSLWNSSDATFSHVSCDECDIHGQDFCDDPSGEEAIEWWNTRTKSAPAEVAQGDDLFVVGYHCRDEKGLATLNWLPHENAVPLMTVAQHNRIVAALTAPPSPDATTLDAVETLITGKTVSVDVSTGDDDYGRRIFATVIGVQEDESDGFVILCDDPNYNHTPSPDAELVELLRKVAKNILAMGMLGLDLAKRIDAKLASLKGERNDNVPKPD